MAGKGAAQRNAPSGTGPTRHLEKNSKRRRQKIVGDGGEGVIYLGGVVCGSADQFRFPVPAEPIWSGVARLTSEQRTEVLYVIMMRYHMLIDVEDLHREDTGIWSVQE